MGAIQPIKCSCVMCKKETSHLGIETHYRRSHGDGSSWVNSIKAKNTQKSTAVKMYENDPVKCAECGIDIPYESRTNTYCSQSCAATSINRNRASSGWCMPESAKESIRQKLAGPKIIVGEFSKIYHCKCKVCGTSFIDKSTIKICSVCRNDHQRATDIFKFKFNVFDYPDIFDIELINAIGWFSQGGKNKIKNPDGASRDHRVSVSDAVKFGYDHYYITHPMNCEIMPHADNNKKKGRSSITYEELVSLVDIFDAIRGNH